jgi:phytoene/squalene synthetase
LIRLAMAILGGEDAARAQDAAARHAGIAYALAGILRSLPHHIARHKLLLPLDLLEALKITREEIFHTGDRTKLKAAVNQMALWAAEHLAKARAARLPPALLPAVLPASLVPLFLRRVTKRASDSLTRTPEVPIHRRQMRLLVAAMRRKI